jgi:cell pole-organizing protein PopZ
MFRDVLMWDRCLSKPQPEAARMGTSGDVESVMTQAAKAQEPSMEEILASIRRIIADDDKPAPQAKSNPPPQPAPPQAAAAKAAPRPAPPKPAVPEKKAPPPPAASNGQDDIDALLADLDAETVKEEVRPPAAASAQAEDDILDLTEDMTAAETEAEFQRIEPHDDLEFNETMESAMAAPPPSRGDVMAMPQDVDPPGAYRSAPAADLQEIPPVRPLLSQSTISAVDSAFNSLAHTVLSQNARTLEDLVREMLRPMLKTWLDDNLPGLVERIVRAEIERVARGR